MPYGKYYRAARRVVRRYLPYAVGTVGSIALDSRGRMPSSYTKTLTKKRGTSGVGVTSQYDARTIYRKRSMPGSKRRKWKKFVKRVRAVQLGSEASRNFVFNNTQLWTATGGQQIVKSIALYGGRGLSTYGSAIGYDDLNQIFSQNPTSEDTTASTTLAFESGVLDITVRNRGLSSETIQPESAEVDVYEIWSYGDHTHQRIDIGNNVNVESLEQAFVDAETNMTTLTNAPSLASRGTTPFDIPQAFKQYRMEIKSKRKYLLQPGQSFTYQLRDPRNHIINRASFMERNLWSLKKVTKMVLIIGKSVTNSTPGPVGGNCYLDVGYTRHYTWKNVLKNNTAGGHN